MKLECSVEKLKNALSLADRITGKNLSLPILSSILMIAEGKSLKLRSTNLSLGIEIEIPSKITKDGVAAIKGDVLSTLFSNINQSSTATLELANDNLLVTTKNNNVLVKNYPPDDFPTIPLVSGKELLIPSKKLIEGLRAVYYSSAISDIKQEISSVYIYAEDDTLIFVATDQFRLAEKKIKVKKIEDFSGILIPFKNISEIVRIFNDIEGDIKMVFSKNQVSFSSDDIYVTSRIIDGIFPDYKQIVPKEFKTEAIVLKQDLLNALKISNIFSDKFNQVTLTIRPKEKFFELYSKNADVGENKTNMDAALKGEPIQVNINYKYLFDCFQSIASDSISLSFNEVNRPMVVRGVSDNSFLYLIMPMNR